MVILGLGSNLGDRLENLRQALFFIRQIPSFRVEAVSPLYMSDALLPENASEAWNMPYLNLALRCETTLTPYEVLQHTKNIEVNVGRTPEKNWGPRIIDIDILAWDDLIQYDEKLHIPHEHLHERPFALWPLADVAPRWIHPQQGKSAAEMVLGWGSRFNGEAPLHTRQIPHRIDTPRLVGILNITPDSFTDGGQFFNPIAAAQHVYQMIEEGAEVIDIGAEATGPHAIPLHPEIEWQRLEPVLDILLSNQSKLEISPKISIDTRHAQVAKKALAKKVDWINDVSGLMDPEMLEIITEHECKAVVMHHLGVPVDKKQFLPHQQEPFSIIYQWAEEKLKLFEKKHIPPERIIFDVGIGYGKTSAQSLELIKHMNFFHKLKTHLLVGHSRKSFLQEFTPLAPQERDLETVVLSIHLARLSIDYLRVHNVGMHSRAFKVDKAI